MITRQSLASTTCHTRSQLESLGRRPRRRKTENWKERRVWVVWCTTRGWCWWWLVQLTAEEDDDECRQGKLLMHRTSTRAAEAGLLPIQ